MSESPNVIAPQTLAQFLIDAEERVISDLLMGHLMGDPPAFLDHARSTFDRDFVAAFDAMSDIRVIARVQRAVQTVVCAVPYRQAMERPGELLDIMQIARRVSTYETGLFFANLMRQHLGAKDYDAFFDTFGDIIVDSIFQNAQNNGAYNQLFLMYMDDRFAEYVPQMFFSFFERRFENVPAMVRRLLWALQDLGELQKRVIRKKFDQTFSVYDFHNVIDSLDEEDGSRFVLEFISLNPSSAISFATVESDDERRLQVDGDDVLGMETRLTLQISGPEVNADRRYQTERVVFLEIRNSDAVRRAQGTEAARPQQHAKILALLGAD